MQELTSKPTLTELVKSIRQSDPDCSQDLAEHEAKRLLEGCWNCMGRGYNPAPKQYAPRGSATFYTGPEFWLWQGLSVDAIDWCNCEEGERQRERYQQRFDAYAYPRLYVKAQEQASVPQRFVGLSHDTVLDLPEEKRTGKIAGIAASIMLAEDLQVCASGLYEFVEHPGLEVWTKQMGKTYPSLMLMGEPGKGKSVMAACWIGELGTKLLQGRWFTWNDWITSIQRNYTPGVGHTDWLSVAQNAEYLVLDDLGDVDLGSNPTTTDKRRLTRLLINHRHERELTTFITTNLEKNELYGQFGGPVAERIMEMCLILRVNGVNLRSEDL